MLKNLHVLNLLNEEDDLVHETDTSNEHWSAVLKIKEGEKLCKYYTKKQNATIPRWKKNPCSRKGN